MFYFSSLHNNETFDLDPLAERTVSSETYAVGCQWIRCRQENTELCAFLFQV